MQFSIEARPKTIHARDAIQPTLFCFLLLGGLLQASTGQPATSKPSALHMHLQKAQTALKANDAEGAAKEFHAILALDPKNVDAHYNLGLLEFSQSNYQDAAQDFRKALAIQPSLIPAKAMLGICARRLGDPSAKALLTSSFEKLADKKLRTQAGIELAGMYYEAGDPEHAASVLQELVDLNPDNTDILYMAQRLYAELADDTLNKLAILAPGSARMQQVIAERLVNAGDMHGAIEHYRKALEIDPHVPGVRYELAEAIFESSSHDSQAQAEAGKELEAVITTEGDSAKVECELGKIALARPDLESAHAHYTRAFSLNPKDPAAQLGLGTVLMTMEKPQEARKYLELAVQSDPLNGEARYRLALAYRTLQMSDEAQKEMTLFQEIKKTKDQVKILYRQMKKQPKPEDEETLGSEK